MSKGSPKRVRQAIIGAVETQLRDGTPPEAREALERLQAEGYSRGEAVRAIARALAGEIYDMMKYQKPYDHERYVGRLERLPEEE